MSLKDKIDKLPIGVIREMNKNRPRNPMYDAIHLVVEDLIPFVSKNFDLDRNIYTLGTSMITYLLSKCKNIEDYFREETIIINIKDKEIKMKAKDTPKDTFNFLLRKYFEPNNVALHGNSFNYSCILNDSLVFLRDLNGEVTPEFIRDYLIKTYKIKDYDLRESPIPNKKEYIQSLRLKTISFRDEIPYGPIKIKNKCKEYNKDFYSKAIDHFSKILKLDDNLTNEIKEEIFSKHQEGKFRHMMCLVKNESGEYTYHNSIEESHLHRCIANSIGRFFFIAKGDQKGSRYIRIRKDLEPYYLEYLKKNNLKAS
tara:strand:+ start:1620 stop:2555 length:936 start_codon:yes stop_codon:yes gene_type:complete